MRLVIYYSQVRADIMQEAETKVVDLDEDDKESVDMLLLYIYTLENPFSFNPLKGKFVEAERAYLIGDKYQMLGLRRAAKVFMVQLTEIVLKRPGLSSTSTDIRARLCSFLERLWTGKFLIRKTSKKWFLENLVQVSSLFMEEDRFVNFLKNEAFNSNFVAALVKKVCKT